MERGGQTTAERLAFAFQEVLSRAPRPEESAVLTALLEKHQREFTTEKDSARQFLAIGQSPAPPALEPGELAAWMSVTRVLLNLHETITRN